MGAMTMNKKMSDKVTQDIGFFSGLRRFYFEWDAVYDMHICADISDFKYFEEWYITFQLTFENLVVYQT